MSQLRCTEPLFWALMSQLFSIFSHAHNQQFFTKAWPVCGDGGIQGSSDHQPNSMPKPLPSVNFQPFELNLIISMLLLKATILGPPLFCPSIGRGHREPPRALEEMSAFYTKLANSLQAQLYITKERGAFGKPLKRTKRCSLFSFSRQWKSI